MYLTNKQALSQFISIEATNLLLGHKLITLRYVGSRHLQFEIESIYSNLES